MALCFLTNIRNGIQVHIAPKWSPYKIDAGVLRLPLMTSTPVTVEVNSFAWSVPNSIIHHYDVVISPLEKTLPARMTMDLIRCLQFDVAPQIFTPRCVYDGRKSIFSIHRLKLDIGSQEFDVTIPDEAPSASGKGPKVYKIKLTHVAEINPEVLHRFGRFVIHPPHGSDGRPSFTALVANVDSDTAKYIAASRVQTSRVKMIEELEAMSHHCLTMYMRYREMARLIRLAWPDGLRRLAEFEFGLAGVGGRGLGILLDIRKAAVFKDNDSVGAVFASHFELYPFVLLALEFAALGLCNSEWSTGKHEQSTFSEKQVGRDYLTHLADIKNWAKINPEVVDKLRRKWYTRASHLTGSSATANVQTHITPTQADALRAELAGRTGDTDSEAEQQDMGEGP
ncbi:hypothetical protein DFH08DRAFT_966102 [Mycena albidolilacea]|uniref:Uncharacterized protein n=1 Tax=Mycena albidolilacea TaxID=1033008 RepID=A0AAD7ELN3_9AGAR|nr:hypothetical protein DFH08DRAFT_966102 [Mycena albidolilacea]